MLIRIAHENTSFSTDNCYYVTTKDSTPAMNGSSGYINDANAIATIFSVDRGVNAYVGTNATTNFANVLASTTLPDFMKTAVKASAWYPTIA